MYLYVLNREEEVVAVLTNEGEAGLLSSAVVKEELNKLNTLHIELSSIKEGTEEVKEENCIIFKDISDNWHEYIIKEIEELHGETTITTVYCEDSSQELIDYVVESEFKGLVSSPSALLTKALLGTRWEAGEVDSIGESIEFTQSVKNCTVLETIGKIRDMWNLQVRYRISVAGNKVVGRYVDLKKNIGVNIGKRFEYSKDIVSVERTVKSTDLKTAIIPYGAEVEQPSTDLKDNIQKDGEEKPKQLIDITGVQWATPKNPINKPLGQNFLEIPEATEQWGYKGADGKMKARYIYYENSEMKTADDLIKEAYKVLKRISKPIVNYKLGVIDLFALTGDYELSFETVNLGDIVTVLDTEFNPAIRIRTSVISKELDLLEPSNTTIELGSFIRNLVDDGGASGNTQLQTVIKDAISEGVAPVVEQVSAVKDGVSQEVSAVKDGFTKQVTDLKQGLSKEVSAVKDGVNQQVSAVHKKVDEEVSAVHKKVAEEVSGVNKRVTEEVSGVNKRVTEEVSTMDRKVSAVDGRVSAVDGRVTSVAKDVKTLTDNKGRFGNGVYEQVKDLNNQLFTSGQGYIYMEESEGLYVYDKPQKGRPMKMVALKGGMLGIGKWNLQTQQWDISSFIDGEMVNASCINTGKLKADLIKVGTLQSLDGSVSINMESGGFQLGGRNGDSVFLDNGQVKTIHKDGSYTIQGADGFVYVNGKSRNEYHHLLQAGEYTCASEQTVRLNVPAEFKGKDFKVVSSIKRVNVYYDVYKAQAPLMSFYAGVGTVNTKEGWFEIYASVRAWDKDNIAEGNIVGDHPTDRGLIKPTVAYWIFL